MAIFFPSNIVFVKKHAKRVQRAFPGLPLSIAQEAVACAFGFSSWFDCCSRIRAERSPPSVADEELAVSERLWRRYQQIRALIDVAGLAPNEVDDFVRCWNPTSRQGDSLDQFATQHSFTIGLLDERDSGRLSEEEFLDRLGGDPFLANPTRVANGVVLGPLGGDKSYYQLDTRRLRQVPVYMRGNFANFLDWEEGRNLALVFPDAFPQVDKHKALKRMAEEQPWHYEWQTGIKAPGFKGVSLQTLARLLSEHPHQWFALSNRYPKKHGKCDLDSPCWPAIKGSEFHQFIAGQGSLQGLDLKWFEAKIPEQTPLIGNPAYPDFSNELDAAMSIKLPLHLVQECLPAYGAPFKFAPMSDYEYAWSSEGGGMALSDELEFVDEFDSPTTSGLDHPDSPIL